jgi:hypothetical protein
VRSGTPMKRSRNDVALRNGAPFVLHASDFDTPRFRYPGTTMSERAHRHRQQCADPSERNRRVRRDPPNELTRLLAADLTPRRRTRWRRASPHRSAGNIGFQGTKHLERLARAFEELQAGLYTAEEGAHLVPAHAQYPLRTNMAERFVLMAHRGRTGFESASLAR